MDEFDDDMAKRPRSIAGWFFGIGTVIIAGIVVWLYWPQQPPKQLEIGKEINHPGAIYLINCLDNQGHFWRMSGVEISDSQGNVVSPSHTAGWKRGWNNIRLKGINIESDLTDDEIAAIAEAYERRRAKFIAEAVK